MTQTTTRGAFGQPVATTPDGARIGRSILDLRGLRFAAGDPGELGPIDTPPADRPPQAPPAAVTPPAPPAPPATVTPPVPTPPVPTPPPTPPVPSPNGDATDAEGKPWTLESAQAEIARLRRRDGDRRVGDKTKLAAALRELAASAGIELPDEEAPTVDSLGTKLTGVTGERDEARTALDVQRRENAANVAAWELGIPADKAPYLNYLLSRNPEFASLDTSAPDFSAKVRSAVEALKGSDATLKGSGIPGASGAEQFGGANGTTAITQERFDSMTYDERLALFQSNPTEYARLTANA